jgi:hypothetical protein
MPRLHRPTTSGQGEKPPPGGLPGDRLSTSLESGLFGGTGTGWGGDIGSGSRRRLTADSTTAVKSSAREAGTGMSYESPNNRTVLLSQSQAETAESGGAGDRARVAESRAGAAPHLEQSRGAERAQRQTEVNQHLSALFCLRWISACASPEPTQMICAFARHYERRSSPWRRHLSRRGSCSSALGVHLRRWTGRSRREASSCMQLRLWTQA